MSSVALMRVGTRRETPADSRRGLSKVFTVVIVVLLLVLAVELAFYLVIAPRLVVKNLQIVTDSVLGLDDAALLAIAGLGEQPFFFDVDAEAIAERLRAYPLIRNAHAQRIFPDTLKIQVTGRAPLALSLVETNGRTIPVAFDEEGVVIQIGSSVNEFDLPVVSGLTFTEVRLGQRIARPLTDFLAKLSRLKETEPLLFSLISELKFVKKDRSGFEVVLFPRDYPVRVLVGTEIDEDIMKKVLLVLDVFSRQGFDEVREIDFRTDDIVMRMRGE